MALHKTASVRARTALLDAEQKCGAGMRLAVTPVTNQTPRVTNSVSAVFRGRNVAERAATPPHVVNDIRRQCTLISGGDRTMSAERCQPAAPEPAAAIAIDDNDERRHENFLLRYLSHPEASFHERDQRHRCRNLPAPTSAITGGFQLPAKARISGVRKSLTGQTSATCRREIPGYLRLKERNQTQSAVAEARKRRSQHRRGGRLQIGTAGSSAKLTISRPGGRFVRPNSERRMNCQWEGTGPASEAATNFGGVSMGSLFHCLTARYPRPREYATAGWCYFCCGGCPPCTHSWLKVEPACLTVA